MAGIRSGHAYSLAGLSAVLLGATFLSGPAHGQNADGVTQQTQGQQTQGQQTQGQGAASANRGGGRTRGPVDPGVRGGDPGAGEGLVGLTEVEKQFFEAAREDFREVETVADGLGPRFNLAGCAGCHSHPSVGGTSPASNPQVRAAQNANNVVPPFITENGPVREARLVRKRDGSPDGGVHNLFVITGRPDAQGCNIRQPDFAAEVARNNVALRIPTPLFGLGLVESVSDATLEAALAADAQRKRALGISGRFNRSANDGTISRFGWKAQDKSLLIFAGEAYNVEMGITNELFPNERENDPSCQLTTTPEDTTPLEPTDTGSPSANFQSAITLFAGFMRLLAPPTPASADGTPVAQSTAATAATVVASADADSILPSAAGTVAATSGSASGSTSAAAGATATVARGLQVFSNVGCNACHVRSLVTAKAATAALSNVTFEPWSDFALHDMGQGLADRVSQGVAGGSEFRTAPLWGVGQRIFFLHDGRTSDLHEAIQLHASRGSEANAVINNYNLLSTDDKQALVNFLRSL